MKSFPVVRLSYRRLAWLLGAVVASVGAAATSYGELTLVENADGQTGLTVVRMTVTPAAAPTPAFKYRLTPTEAELLPGNAALYYCRAFAEGGVRGVWESLEKEHGYEEVHGEKSHSGWYNVGRPLKGLPLDKVRDAARRFDVYIKQCVERGAQRQHADWSRNLEELRGVEIIELLLPELQETRSLSRAIMLQARVAVADGDFDRAIELLRMNYQMARHVGSDVILISGLVGIAECSMGNLELIELIAAKNSPNMYWALAAMPRPLIDVLPAVRRELGWGARIFPVLEDPETANHTAEEWGRLLAESVIEAQQAFGSNNDSLELLQARLGMTGVAVFLYPDAKRRLINSGMDAQRVEQMPVGQVLAIDAAREYRRIGDEFEKSWYVPFKKMRTSPNPDVIFEGNKFEGGLGRVMAGLLMPALHSVRNAQVRLDWQLGALQVVEALRLHAAETGKLPASLDEITSVHVPKNPATDNPYQYRLEGDTAVLELPSSDGFSGVAWRFEIKLAK